jgi:hypothetical protein
MGPVENKTVCMCELLHSIFVVYSWKTEKSLPLATCMDTYGLAGHEVCRIV